MMINKNTARVFARNLSQRPINGQHDAAAAGGSAGDGFNFGRLRLDNPVNRSPRIIPFATGLVFDHDLGDFMVSYRYI